MRMKGGEIKFFETCTSLPEACPTKSRIQRRHRRPHRKSVPPSAGTGARSTNIRTAIAGWPFGLRSNHVRLIAVFPDITFCFSPNASAIEGSQNPLSETNAGERHDFPWRNGSKFPCSESPPATFSELFQNGAQATVDANTGSLSTEARQALSL